MNQMMNLKWRQLFWLVNTRREYEWSIEVVMVQFLDIRFMIKVGKNMIWNCIGTIVLTSNVNQQVFQMTFFSETHIFLEERDNYFVQRKMLLELLDFVAYIR
jgi:hypothetical protein